MSNEEDREALDIAVMTVLTNVMNFPEKVQARLLGQDMRPLGSRVIDAVLDAGFHSTPAPTPDVQALIAEARGHLAVAADAAPRSARAAILAGDVEDQRMSLVARLADAPALPAPSGDSQPTGRARRGARLG